MAQANPVLEDLARLRRELAALSKMSIHVGIQGDEDGELLKIAAVHEYGMTIKMTDKMRRYLGAIGMFSGDENYTPPSGHQTGYVNIPERSFIRASFDTGQRELSAIIQTAVGKVIQGTKTALEAMDEIGLLAAQMTQDFINTGSVEPPKSKFTQERTSQYTPLVDSGRLALSITHRVEGGG